jgi:hypothetical protein
MRTEGYAREMPALGKSGQILGPYPQGFEDRHIEHVFKVSSDFCFVRSLAEAAMPNPVAPGTPDAADAAGLAAIPSNEAAIGAIVDFSELPETARDLIAAAQLEADSILLSHLDAANELATVANNLGLDPSGIGYSPGDLPLGMARAKLAEGPDRAAIHLFGAIAPLWWNLVKPDTEAFKAKLDATSLWVAQKYHTNTKALDAASRDWRAWALRHRAAAKRPRAAPAFWRSLREDFEKLQAAERLQGHHFSLIVNLGPLKDMGEPRNVTDYGWDSPDPGLKTRLSALALRGARGLGYESEYHWYDELSSSESVQFDLRGTEVVVLSEGALPETKWGRIGDVVNESITFCHKLEAEPSSPSPSRPAPPSQIGAGPAATEDSQPGPSETNSTPERRSVAFSPPGTVLPAGIAKRATRMGLANRQEIEKHATDEFAVAQERIAIKHGKKWHRAKSELGQRGNIRGYAPTLTALAARHVRQQIIACADAYVKAFTLFGSGCDAEAERSLEVGALQIAGGAVSAVCGEIDLISKRTRKHLNDPVGYVNREIEKSRLSALREGRLRLKRQRIKFVHNPTPAEAAKPSRSPEHDVGEPMVPMPPVKGDAAGQHLGKRLKKLKTESRLPWKIVVAETGISYRWLLDIQSGRTPSAEKRKAIRDYFSRVLERSVRF